MVTIIDCSGHFFPRDSDRIPDLPDTMASEVGVRDTSGAALEGCTNRGILGRNPGMEYYHPMESEAGRRDLAFASQEPESEDPCETEPRHLRDRHEAERFDPLLRTWRAEIA